MLGILFGVPGYANQFQNRLAAVSLLSKVRMVHYKLLTYPINISYQPTLSTYRADLIFFPAALSSFASLVMSVHFLSL